MQSVLGPKQILVVGQFKLCLLYVENFNVL